MEQVRQIHVRYYEQADRALSQIPLAQVFQTKTGVPKVYGAVGASAFVLLLVFLNIGAPLLVNLVGFGYASYASFLAIESPGKEDDAQWLTYWVIFGLSNVAEYFTGLLTYWIPFYYVFKLAFLVWLMLPATRGAERLYHNTLKPVVAHIRSSNLPASTQQAGAPPTAAAARKPAKTD
ncbi:ER membrane protein DP1/Yop1 [Coemansia sp. RSA 2322]|uniref:Protein YOP1 n=1 Tax=Coemansia thaxteri TaxID=2663907 RepID=A0A9W8B6K9_9FUNG|nr:ER membrane protein DP1/Yop1 [Coemansia thaxteri]KAJ2462100.1 ER membrane protein DP1/Yop1 [Coemansia sp. RSA 2322]KAJ2477406.1 ER membrane protein DP1/Yop1 [Coemansia sp. RSA 2320]